MLVSRVTVESRLELNEEIGVSRATVYVSYMYAYPPTVIGKMRCGHARSREIFDEPADSLVPAWTLPRVLQSVC